jgi:Lon protease-like protein
LEQLTDIPEILPVLPSTSTLVYPTAMNQLTIEDESALRLLDDIRDSHRLLVIAARKSSGSGPAHLSDLFHVGTVARLALMRPAGNGKREITLLGLERVIIGAAVQERPYLLAQVVLKPDLEMPEDAPIDEINEAIAVFEKLIARSQKMPLHEVAYDFERTSLRERVYIMAFFSQPDLERGQQLLELDSPAARLSRLKDFLATELEQFDQEWQAAFKRVQEQAGSKIEVALDRLNTAETLKSTFQVLTRYKSLLVSKKGLDALRLHIAHARQQKAARRWIFLLTQDLDLLEKAYKHGLSMVRGYLNALGKMRGSQQAVLEALKVLTTLDVDDPETLQKVMERQETHPFSPETFAAMYALSEQMGDPEDREQLQAILHLLEDVQKIGKEKAIKNHVHLRNPDFNSEIEHALDVLEQYLTSQSAEGAFLILKQHQEILLSDMVEQIVQQHITERSSVGDQRSARMLEMHLSLFEDARQRGLDAAWQTFIEEE